MLPLKSVSRSDAYFTRYGTAKLVAWLASASQDASYANFIRPRSRQSSTRAAEIKLQGLLVHTAT